MKFRQCSVSGVKYEEVKGKLCFKAAQEGDAPSPVQNMKVNNGFCVKIDHESAKFYRLLMHVNISLYVKGIGTVY